MDYEQYKKQELQLSLSLRLLAYDKTWITQYYLQTTPCMPLPRKRSPDGAPLTCDGVRLTAAYYASVDPERMKG